MNRKNAGLQKTLINYSLEGESATIRSDKQGLEFMFGSGTPLNEPIIYGGPFVATTPQQMREVHRRYADGKMGMLQPYDGSDENITNINVLRQK